MTIGKMIEIVTGKVSALTGMRVNATAFKPFDLREFQDILAQHGFNRTGKEVMYSGMTGEPYEVDIFIGPCYYQFLRHLIQNKVQVRDTGPISSKTRQPLAGRSQKGGLKYGEMESKGTYSHGAAGVLRERLIKSSDMFQMMYCRRCGRPADGGIRNCEGTPVYNCMCGKEPDLVRVQLPYMTGNILRIINSMKIDVRVKFADEKKSKELKRPM